MRQSGRGDESSTAEEPLRSGERLYAAFFLRNKEALPGAINFNQHRLLLAATIMVAEAQTSRNCDQAFSETYVLKFLNAATVRVVG